MEPEPLLDSLRNAVNAMPDDVPLRLHLATMLLRAGQRDEAVRHLGAVLQRDPGNAEAMRMLTSPAEVSGPPASPPADVDGSSERARGSAPPATGPSPVQDGPRRRRQDQWCRRCRRCRRCRVPPARRTATTGRRPRMSCATCCPRCSSARRGRSPPGSTRPVPTTPSTRASRWPTWPGSTRSRSGLRRRSSPRCATRSSASSTASRCAAGCCFTVRPAAVRRSSPARWPASSARASSRCRSPT